MKLKETVFIFSHSKVFADFNLKLRSRFRKSSQGKAAFILIQNGAKSSKKHFLHLVLFDNKYNRFQLEWTNRILLPTLVFCCTLKSEETQKMFTCAFKNTKCVSAGLQGYRGCSCVFPVRTLSFQSVHRRGLSHSGPTAGPWGADTDLPQHFILAVETSHKVSACGWLSLMETKVTAGGPR